MHITTDEILRNVSAAFFKRGRAYFREGRVVSLNIDFEDESVVDLSSSVKGSGRHVYQQEITISKAILGIDIDAYCSCPVGYNCKHVIAACLKYQQQASELKLDWSTGRFILFHIATGGTAHSATCSGRAYP